MKIEIIIGDSGPEIYVFKNDKLTIGKDSSCDVTVADPEISRKHLEIFSEDGKVYVVDPGSLNGTYLNEERLAPGHKIEFHSFFPLRLGTNVLLSLLDDNAEVSILENQKSKNETQSDVTRIVSLRDLKSANTKKLMKKSLRKSSKQNVKPIKKKFKLSFINGAAILILIVGAAYSLTNKKTTAVKEAVLNVHESVIKNKVLSEQRIELQKLLGVEKCKDELETTICASISSPLVFPWGAKINGDTAYIQLQGSKYYDEAKLLLNKKGMKTFSEAEAWKVAAALFLMEGIRNDFDSSAFIGKKMVFAFYSSEEIPTLAAVITISPEALKNVKVLLVRRRLDALSEKGTDVIKFTEDYYSVQMTDRT